MERSAPSCVVLGLSGGVDSSVAAWLLKEQGHNVIAVTLGLAAPEGAEDSRSCCSPSLMARAKAVADHLGIRHYAIDEREAFGNRVVDYFVSEYERGRTPNPCAKCNSLVRFEALTRIAHRLGAGAIATGHYARLTGDPLRLTRGADKGKDQSYVLSEVDPALLEGCLFPLGGLAKTDVRKLAARIGIGDVVARESQEICFVPGDDYRGFLRARLGELPGSIIDGLGSVLGSHKGTYNYTVGQRRGLGVGGGPPLYVTRIDVDRHEVVAGEGAHSVRMIEFAVSAEHRSVPCEVVDIQFRSAGRAVRGRLDGQGTIELLEPAAGVAPGQTVAVYHGEDLLLGGTISGTR